MTTHKRLLSGLLSAAMAVMLMLTAAPAFAAGTDTTGNTGYTDVDPGSSYAEAVAFCLERGLMNGVSATEMRFDPMGTMTRGMMATVLYRMSGEPEVTGDNPFEDVVAGSWYGPAVIWAAEQGIVEGDGTGRYNPNDNVSREQLAVYLWRYAGRPLPDGTMGSFADEDEISAWASQAVEWAWENGIMDGKGESRFSPLDDALRYELATALMNYVLYSEEPEPEPEPEPEVDPWEEFQSIFGYVPQLGTVAVNSYNMEQFVVDEQGYMSYQGGLPCSIGVDVSSHQKKIDWQQVADAGVEFAMIRVGYRGYTMGTLNTDAYFVDNIEGALAAGLKVGVYFFSQAVTVEEAVEEAQYTLQLIRNYNITYPVVFDWERQSASTSRTKDTDENTVAACAVAFCETVEAAGYTPMFYASPTKAYSMELGYLSGYAFWLAHYTKNMAPTSYKYHFDMWQYTNTGTVPGIDGNVDVNICMRYYW